MALAMLALAGGAGAMADEAKRGEALFQGCRACHSLDPGTPGMAGPPLDGLAGRLLGSAWGFDYSPGFRQARAQGLRWDGARLEAYLADPDSIVPGGWMSPPGGLSDAGRAAVAAYLLAR